MKKAVANLRNNKKRELRSSGLLVASSSDSLPTFRCNLSVPSSRVKNPNNSS